MTALEALAPYARRGAGRSAAAAGEACEICAAPVAEQHAHVVDLVRRGLRCACPTCARLFDQPSAGARYRTVPRRVLHDPTFTLAAARWADLQIPVGLAFVLYDSARSSWVAHYPSPAGATESELPLDAWRALVAERPLVAAIQPDVEALLVYGPRGATTLECHLVPVDLCYELVARIRRHWKGFEGGDGARGEIERFFAELRARRRTFAPRSAGGGPARREPSPGGGT
jgi:hypothetical protein